MRASAAAAFTVIALVCWGVLTLASPVLAPEIAALATEAQVALGFDVSHGERTR